MATIIVSAPLPGTALDRLRTGGHQVIVGEDPCGMGRDGLLAQLRAHPETEALICLLSDRVDGELLDAGRRMRVVANCAVGTDNLDLEALRGRNIVATNTPGVLTDATADLTFALILDACRNVSAGDRLVRSGQWRGWSPTLLLGMRVTGATLGLIGFGRIGKAGAARARGFGMRVLYNDTRPADPAVEHELGAAFAPIDRLLGSADIVSLHCPLTPQTRGILDRARLLSMRPGAVLVNTARGACVDEVALAELLRSGHLGAAALDVYAHEPGCPSALIELPNVVLAPHIGSADRPTRETMAEMCVQSVMAVLVAKQPQHRVV
jgi:glyoxylate reductase